MHFHSCSMSIHITLCISDVRDLFVWLSDSAVHAGACLWRMFVWVVCMREWWDRKLFVFQSFVPIIIAGCIKPATHFEVIPICFHLKQSLMPNNLSHLAPCPTPANKPPQKTLGVKFKFSTSHSHCQQDIQPSVTVTLDMCPINALLTYPTCLKHVRYLIKSSLLVLYCAH